MSLLDRLQGKKETASIKVAEEQINNSHLNVSLVMAHNAYVDATEKIAAGIEIEIEAKNREIEVEKVGKLTEDTPVETLLQRLSKTAGALNQVDDAIRLKNEMTKAQKAIIAMKDGARIAGGAAIGGITGNSIDAGNNKVNTLLGAVAGAAGGVGLNRVNADLLRTINKNRLQQGRHIVTSSPLLNLAYLG